MKYRTKPVEVEARQLTKGNREEISKWLNGGISGNQDDKSGLSAWYYDSNGESELYVLTKGSQWVVVALKGDWIARDTAGVLRVLKTNVFEALYEKVD